MRDSTNFPALFLQGRGAMSSSFSETVNETSLTIGNSEVDH